MTNRTNHTPPEGIAYGVLAQPITAAAGADDDVWIKLAPLGKVTGRDGRGPYDFGDRVAAEKVVAATTAYLTGIDGVIDYDHGYDLGAMQGRGRAPAAGWIKEFRVDDDGIHGRVEWTDRAAAAIKGREYRYISPTFMHDKSGRVTLIPRAGLTTHPNFEMPALASAGTNTEDDVTIPKELLDALGVAPGADDAATTTAAVKAAGELRATGDKLAGALGLAAGTGGDVLATAAVALKAKADAGGGGSPDPTQWVPMAAYLEVSTALAFAQTGGKASAAAAMADKLSAEGKLTPASRDWFISLAASDPAKADEYVKVAPVIVAPGTVSTAAAGGVAAAVGGGGMGCGRLNDVERDVCRQMGYTEAEFVKFRDGGAGR